jgi:hypothetical protein
MILPSRIEKWKDQIIIQRRKKKDTGNWRLMRVISIIWRVIFCRIAQALHEAYENE